jgi:predicted DNA-binding transcriptional regulator AlpA
MRFLTWREVADRLSVSISTAKRLQHDDDDFPPRVKISAGRVGFPEDAFNSYIARLTEREAA